MIKVCKKCLMPNSRPRVSFNSNGICNACVKAENNAKIDWNERKSEFTKILEI